MAIKSLNRKHGLKRGDIVLIFGQEARVRRVLSGHGADGWIYLSSLSGDISGNYRASQCVFVRHDPEFE